MYCFDYRGEFHRFGHLRNPLPFEIDATLSDDNIFLFPYPAEVSQLNMADKAMARALVTMWVNFATYGTPNLNSGIWPNVSSEYGPFLRFTNAQESNIELDYHFGDGIPVPDLYPEYFNTTKANGTLIKTKTTTTTSRPYSNRYTNQNRRGYSAHMPVAAYPNYRSHETTLNNLREDVAQPLPTQYNSPQYSSLKSFGIRV